MHAALRVLPFAFFVMVAGAASKGQVESRPPIFVEPAPPAESTPGRPVPKSFLSERVRTLVNAASERVLADAKAFDLPVETVTPEPTPTPAGGIVQMPRYVVRSRVFRRDAIEPPAGPRLNFTAIIRDDPRMIGGYTTNLFRLLKGQGEINLNILQAVGRGIDHGHDFTRAEIEFRFRW